MQPVSRLNYFVQFRNAVAIQSAIRGYLARKYTILPRDIEHLCDDNRLLATLICREANLYLQEKTSAPKTITAWTKPKVLLNDKLEQLPQKKFYLKRIGELLLLIFPEEGAEAIAEGQSKKYFPSKTMLVPLPVENKWATEVLSVLVLPKKEDPFLENTIRIHRHLLDFYLSKRPEGVHLVDPLEMLESGIYHQLKSEESGSKFFLNGAPVSGINKCLKEATKTIFWLHGMQTLHGKVKLSNFLIINRKEGPTAYLSDFDGTESYRASPVKTYQDNPYWDHCACNGIHTPFQDLFGLAYIFVQTKIGSLSEQTITRVRNRVFEDTKQRGHQTALSYWNFFQNNKHITSLQQDIWSLFIFVCKESSKTFLRIPSQGQLGKEEVEKYLNYPMLSNIKKEFFKIIDKL